MPGRLSKKALDELMQNLKNPTTRIEQDAHVLQLQRRVAVQQKLIDDLSSAVTQLQQRLYAINHKLNQTQTQTQKG